MKPMGRGGFVKLQTARIGTKVRVQKGHGIPNLEGCIGTIVRSFVVYNRWAFKVRFKDGHLGLFWHHELEEVEEEGAVLSVSVKPRASGKLLPFPDWWLTRHSRKKEESERDTETYITLPQRIPPSTTTGGPKTEDASKVYGNR